LDRFRRDDAGQVAILVAIAFLALVFTVAVVVNTAQLFVQRRGMQGTADAAALAGAYSLNLDSTGSSQANAIATAIAAAALNGYTTSAATLVTVNIPPHSGPNQDTRHVEVIITTGVSTALVQWGTTNVTARAVAGTSGPPSQAIFALDRNSDRGALQVQNGNLAMYSPGAPIGCTFPVVAPCDLYGGNAQVNSTDNLAANCFTGCTVVPSSASLNVAGCDSTGWPSAQCAQPQLEDPYFAYPKPRPDASLNWCNKDRWNAATNPCGTYNTIPSCPGSGAMVLPPGVYLDTLSGNCDFILDPGVFVFLGHTAGINNPSNIRINGGIGTDTFESTTGQPSAPGGTLYARDATFVSCGTAVANNPFCGVTLFFSYAVYPTVPGTDNCAQMKIAGGNSADLSPDPGGTWAGMLVYYDDNCPAPGSGAVAIGGGATLNSANFRGLFYVPTGTVSLGGANTAGNVSQIVAYQVNARNGDMVVNVATAQVRARGAPRLVE
jgi:Flp pilus assembly protein TadG